MKVENTSDLPSDFLRVEFKTDPKDAGTLRGRFFREVAPPGENLQKVQFENDQIRITRLVCAAGRSLPLTARDTEPMLLIDLTWSVGKEQWVASGQPANLRNERATAREWLRFDFKTPPLS